MLNYHTNPVKIKKNEYTNAFHTEQNADLFTRISLFTPLYTIAQNAHLKLMKLETSLTNEGPIDLNSFP